MRRHLSLIFAVFALASFVHAEEWTKTYTIATKPELRVDTDDVNLRVDTWDQRGNRGNWRPARMAPALPRGARMAQSASGNARRVS